MSQPSLDSQFKFDQGHPIYEELRSLMVALENRFAPLDALRPTFEDQVEQFRETAIARIDAVITPAYEKLQEIARLGVIFEASSPDIKSSFVGQQTWSIAAEDSDRFAPAGTVAIVSATDPAVWMSGKVVSYDRPNRQLIVQAAQAYGTTLGTRQGWSIFPAQPFHDTVDAGTKDSPVAGGGPTRNIFGSNTAGYVPTGTDIIARSLFVNWADGKVYWRRASDGVVQTSAALNDLLVGADKVYLAGLISANASAIAANTAAISNRVRFDAAQVLTDPQIGTVLTSLKYALRADALNSWSLLQAATARFNLAKPATLRIAANTTLDASLSSDAELEFLGAYTITAPAAASVFDGWRSGIFHNRGNGSITTATFVGTIAVPNNAYLDGVQNGTKTLSYAQKGYLYFDAQATPNATWRWVWVDRSPLLLAGSYTGIASFDMAFPAGYQRFDLDFSSFLPSINNSGLQARLSADGGVTFRSGANDYVYNNVAFYNGGSAVAGASATSSSIVLLGGSATGAGFTDARAACGIIKVEAKYGTCLCTYGQVIGTSADVTGVCRSGQQAGAASITPNLLRLFSGAGGTMALTMSIRGVPLS